MTPDELAAHQREHDANREQLTTLVASYSAAMKATAGQPDVVSRQTAGHAVTVATYAVMLPTNELAGLLAAAVEELAEKRHLFDMQWRRMGEATARWRAEDPAARELISPDLGTLLAWLMADADKARAQLRR